MALRQQELADAGGYIVGISIDSPAQHAYWIETEALPFPLLSDPDRSLAIEPFGVSNPTDERNIAKPATIVIGPDGDEVFRAVSEIFPDRPHEDEALDVVRALGLDPVVQPPLARGTPIKGPKAMPFDRLGVYFRGAKFSLIAASRKFPELPQLKEYSLQYGARMDRYIEAVAKTKARLAKTRVGA